MALASIEDQISTARELTGEGDYTGAIVYYDGALSQIARYISQIKDPYIIGKWHETVKALQTEQSDLKHIHQELDTIREQPPAPPVSRAPARFHEYDDPARQNAVMHFDDMFTRAPQAASHNSERVDPDVWRPPSREGFNRGAPPPPRSGYPPRKGNVELPAWARKEPPPRAGPSNSGPPAGRDRSAPRAGSRSAAGNNKAPSGRGDNGRIPTGGGNGRDGSGHVNGNGRGRDGREGKEGKEGKKKEYAGPDGDLAEMLQNDVIDSSPGVKWTDIAGLLDAKRVLEEAMVLPLIMPEFFTGIRTPHRGVLLFGPPGTGKTMLAKAVATECNCTFFNISSATLASKYRGESERMVRCLFELARVHAPSVIFIDEVDSLCTSRGKEGEHEASRRVKSELLVQIDGCHGQQNEDGSRAHVMVLAATNFPWDIDEAFRRRLEKRIYIPLPKADERSELLRINLRTVEVDPDVEFEEIARQLHGYSGDDITNICKDAAMNIMRRKIAGKRLTELKDAGKDLIKEPIVMDDFLQAIHKINPSVSQDDIKRHEQWLSIYGSV